MKHKTILISIIAVIIVIIILTAFIVKLINEQKSRDIILTEEEGVFEVEIDRKIKEVQDRNNYYAIKDCINKFYLFYASMFNTDAEANEGENAEAVCMMLDKEYTNEKGITKDNVLTKLKSIKESVIDITNMYVSQRTNNIYVYIASGCLREKVTGEITDFQIMIKQDTANKTFSVYLEDYISEKYKGIAVGEELNIDVDDTIEKKTYNMYDYNYISDETYATYLFDKYKEEILYNPELLYQYLDSDYKNKRFGTLEEFKEYAKDNIRRNVITKIDKYQKTTTDNYTQYVCIDQNGKYYIFRETSVMNYAVILDTYTIDLPEFTEKYEKSSDKEKVLMNIQRFFDAINDGDYKYAYSKLDETFKANNFKTQSDFENYVKSNFFTQNKLSAGKAEKQGDIYLYDVTISDSSEASTNSTTTSFVMKLKEGTDFVMSFGVK